MFSFLKKLFTSKKIKNYSLTTTTVTQGEDKYSDINVDLKAVHGKIRENPVSNLTFNELNLVMEKDLNLKPFTATFFSLNKAMVDITVLEFTSMNIMYNKTTDKVDNVEFTFTDAVNNTGAKLILPAEAVSELLTPITFKKVTTRAN